MKKSRSRPNSSNTKPSRNLAGSSSSERAKDFLIRLANMHDKAPPTWLQTKFPDVLEAVSRAPYASYRPGQPEVYAPGSPEHDELTRKFWLIPLRDTLRAIWRAPDLRTKEWGLFRISQNFFLQGDPNLIKLPTANVFDFMLSWKPPTRTEQFLLGLMRWADLLRYCGNSDCPEPYFIATRRSRKYCCLECSAPAQRESKRRWWAEHGVRRRRAATSRR